MLVFYTSIATALAKVISGNIGLAISGLFELPGELQRAQERVASQADVVGFVTAVVNVGREAYAARGQGMEGGGDESGALVDELSAVSTTQTVDDEIAAV